ncbi:MAG: hypothetical protein KC592_18710 [Nitrospira sp.]|nr:hypothetical protein [Nitrospira sp.]
MNRLILLLGTMSSLIVFLIVTSDAPSFGEDMIKKTVDITIEFSKDDGGKKEMKPKKSDWEPIKEIPSGADLIYSETVEIKVYKVNPCYVCMGGTCYVKQNC